MASSRLSTDGRKAIVISHSRRHGKLTSMSPRKGLCSDHWYRREERDWEDSGRGGRGRNRGRGRGRGRGGHDDDDRRPDRYGEDQGRGRGGGRGGHNDRFDRGGGYGNEYGGGRPHEPSYTERPPAPAYAPPPVRQIKNVGNTRLTSSFSSPLSPKLTGSSKLVKCSNCWRLSSNHKMAARLLQRQRLQLPLQLQRQQPPMVNHLLPRMLIMALRQLLKLLTLGYHHRLLEVIRLCMAEHHSLPLSLLPPRQSMPCHLISWLFCSRPLQRSNQLHNPKRMDCSLKLLRPMVDKVISN